MWIWDFRDVLSVPFLGLQAAGLNDHCFPDHEKKRQIVVVIHCQIYSINTLRLCSARAGEKSSWTHWHAAGWCQFLKGIGVRVVKAGPIQPSSSVLLLNTEPGVAECRGQFCASIPRTTVQRVGSQMSSLKTPVRSPYEHRNRFARCNNFSCSDWLWRDPSVCASNQRDVGQNPQSS